MRWAAESGSMEFCYWPKGVGTTLGSRIRKHGVLLLAERCGDYSKFVSNGVFLCHKYSYISWNEKRALAAQGEHSS